MTEKGTFVIDFRSVERKTMMTITLAIAILLFPAPSSAKDPTSLVGLARVIDGDTVEIAGERMHLQGVDTPEPDQECRNAGNVAYPCGQDATNALRVRIGDDSIRCEIEPERDRYDRAIGVCFALDGTDLNGWARPLWLRPSLPTVLQALCGCRRSCEGRRVGAALRNAYSTLALSARQPVALTSLPTKTLRPTRLRLFSAPRKRESERAARIRVIILRHPTP